jgi:hypothetical protein
MRCPAGQALHGATLLRLIRVLIDVLDIPYTIGIPLARKLCI